MKLCIDSQVLLSLTLLGMWLLIHTIIKVPWMARAQTSLRWRHNGRDGVSNHQPHDCFLNSLFGRRSKKTSKFRVTGLCGGNSPGTGEFPAQMASYAENASIGWRHHVLHIFNFPLWSCAWWIVVRKKVYLHLLSFLDTEIARGSGNSLSGKRKTPLSYIFNISLMLVTRRLKKGESASMVGEQFSKKCSTLNTRIVYIGPYSR